MLNSKNFHSMHILWELPTNKANFLFKNTQNFNQTTHVGPQEPIVIIHNIILYFHSISSVKDLIEESQTVMSWPFQDSLNFFKFCGGKHPDISKCTLFNMAFLTQGLHNQFSTWQRAEFGRILMNKKCKYFAANLINCMSIYT